VIRGWPAIRYLAGRFAGRPERPATRFFVLSQKRSGSTLFGDLLDSHPAVVCQGEIFGAPLRFPYLRIQNQAQQAAADGATAYGFKILTQQVLAFPRDRGFKLVDTLVRHDWRVIHLAREDHLRMVLSAMHAEGRQWHHRSSDGEFAYQPLAVDPAEVLARLVDVQKVMDGERDYLHHIPHLNLSYEKDLENGHDHQRTADRVFSWLGLPAATVTTDLTKLAPRTLEKTVANLPELRRHLARTPYARFVDAAENV